mmetsp:Transcript_27422/g.42187  ORF Transcript_27422/g.42187 Transcript_27422/m.42187 type:complete len:99 (-) Transcript_27422:289-585(-)
MTSSFMVVVLSRDVTVKVPTRDSSILSLGQILSNGNPDQYSDDTTAIATQAREKKYRRLNREIRVPSFGGRFQVRIKLKRSTKYLIRSANEHMKKVPG